MKTLAFLAIAALFVGCTATTTTTTSNTAPQRDYLSNKRVYTQDDLRKTGRLTVAGALEQADPAITISHGGR